MTAPDSAAYADFLRTLTASGFSFQILHVAATMQGAATAGSVVSAIRRLQGESLDLICIVRGGGSPIDLAWLDHESIARAVAACPLPIWVGIGHEIDFGVLDHIAHASHKTPTALAETLVGLLREVDNRLTAAVERLTESGSRLVDLARQRLETRENGLRQGTRKHQQIQDARFGQKVGRLQTLLAQHTERRAGRFQKAATTLLERSRAILDRSDVKLASASGSLRADAFRLVVAREEKLDRSVVGLTQGTRKQLTAIQDRVSRHPQTLQAIVDRRTARLAEALSAARARLQTGSRGHRDAGEQRLRWRQGRITADAYVLRVALADERLAAKLAHVESLRPKRLLARGYSITRTAAGAVVRSIADVPPGTVVLTSLADGTATSNVTKTEERSDG